VDYVRTEMLSRMQQTQQAGLVHMPRPMMVPKQGTAGRETGSATRQPAAKLGRK
jgi:hypothetical protein